MVAMRAPIRIYAIAQGRLAFLYRLGRLDSAGGAGPIECGTDRDVHFDVNGSAPSHPAYTSDEDYGSSCPSLRGSHPTKCKATRRAICNPASPHSQMRAKRATGATSKPRTIKVRFAAQEWRHTGVAPLIRDSNMPPLCSHSFDVRPHDGSSFRSPPIAQILWSRYPQSRREE